ncbi:MAG: PD-(D/E)XK nuclease family protein [Methanomicrobium sp.]|nr:PD-(D/E)XK nuclease family protein [Methanomicrobium sp.]
MPEKILIKTPPGYGLKRCIELFKADYKASPLSAFLIVPTERLSKKVKEALLKDGISVVERSITTPGEFACRIIKDCPDFKLITEEEAKMLLLKVIKENKGHIEALSPSKDLSSRLLNDIYTLIKVVFEHESDYKKIFSSGNPTKNSALTAIIKDYESLLDLKGLVPPEAVWAKAGEFLENADSNRDLNKEKFKFYSLSFSGLFEPLPAVKSFIRACASHSEKTVYFMPFCTNQKVCTDEGKWFDAGITEEEKPSLYSSACTGIFSSEKPKEIPAKVYAKRYRNIKSEISGIAAGILPLLDAGVKPCKIAVAFPDPAGATALIDEIFPDFGLSYSSSATVPFSRSPLVQSVLLITEVISKNFSRESVTELLASPYMAPLLKNKGANSENPAFLADIVAGKAMIEDGFFSWEKNIKKFIKREEGRVLSSDTPDFRKKDIEKDMQNAEIVLNSVVPLLSDLNRLICDDTYKGHIKRLISLLKSRGVPYIDDSCGRDILYRDTNDLEKLLSLLEGLSGTSEVSGDEKITFYEFSRFFSSAAGSLRVSLKRDDSKIQISGIQGLQDTEFDYIFLGGLVDGKIPDIPSLLPYTNENEDRAIWPEKRREKVRWERFYFISALCAAKSGVFLSCHNEAGGKQEIPSQFYETAANMLSAETPDDLERTGSFFYSVLETGRCLSKGEIYENFCLPKGVSPVFLLERINIEGFHRSGFYDSPYDGLLSAEDDITAVLEERFNEKHAYSPTSLETYAGCPFRFYLSHVIGLNPPQEKTFTLSASDRGELLHRTLFSFYLEWMKNHQGSPSEKEKDEALSLIRSCAVSNIESYGIQGPAWDSMAKEILGETGYGRGILEKFISEETELFQTGLVPKYFEAGFGFKGAGTSFSDEPVEVVSKNGKSIFLRGFVDRIDVMESPGGTEFVIVDYKTGSHPNFNEISKGKALQIPLYLKAAEAAKNMRGIGGFYYKLSKREVFRKAELYDQSEEELFSHFRKAGIKGEIFEDVVERSVDFACRYAENIKRGIFTPANETGGCSSYCEFKPLCRFSEFRLLEQDNLKGLEEFRENTDNRTGEE